jgi:hypothetical protein
MPPVVRAGPSPTAAVGASGTGAEGSVVTNGLGSDDGGSDAVDREAPGTASGGPPSAVL